MGKKKKLAKLEAREAEIAAELKRREKKSKKKGKKAKAEPAKKSKKAKSKKAEPVETVDAAALGVITIEAEAPIVPTPEEPATSPADVPSDDPAIVYAMSVIADLGKDDDRHPHLAHLDHVGRLIEKSKGSGKKAEKAAAELLKLRRNGEKALAERDAARAAADVALAAKVKAKKAEREKISKADRRAALEDEALGIDRADADAVRAYNAEAVKVGATLLTSDDEREKIAARQTVEEVETESGRVFEAGAGVDPAGEVTFAKPSEAGPELEENRLGYKIIQLGADGKPDPKKVKAMARVTTFVNNIDDETTLKRWDKRMVIEGLALDATSPDSEELVPKINDIVHRRDRAIEKAIRQDRKGKLGIGDVGVLVAAAEKEAKDALDIIHERAAELAGRNDKAKAGSHLHRLAELSDKEGIDAVRMIHEAGLFVADPQTGEEIPVTATDLATTEAYAEAMTRLGAKVLYSEAIIVNDDLGNAGRLDRIISAKLPEMVIGKGTPGEYVRPADQRARRYVGDQKSGRIDLGAGKISRQLAAYALGKIYDPETGERTAHSASRDIALVFHTPQGMGTCTVHAVDLKAGIALLKLSAEIRRARNTGKKTIDAKVNIIDLLPEIEA